MILPSYNIHSLELRQQDYKNLTLCSDINSLSFNLLGVSINDVANKNAIIQYFQSPSFLKGADLLPTNAFFEGLSTVLIELLNTAKSFGFPGLPIQKKQESKIDFALSKTLIESLEITKFEVNPCHGNSRYIQEFMTQRVLALLVFWRWHIVTDKSISDDRILSSPRNYFYTLWISGWLFDKGRDEKVGRWELFDYMSADSLVQIIERSGIGYRKGFAQAIAMERKNRSFNTQNSILDNLVRGCMKRATFTFSTSVMIDDTNYYNSICKYLFDWADKNYLLQKN